MFHNMAAIKQVARAALGECVCVALMLGVYAIIGRFSTSVLIGAVFGGVVTTLNFLVLSITVSKAADIAESGNFKKGKAIVQVSSVLRLLILAALYILVLKVGLCDPVAAILPLLFFQLSLSVIEYFRKDGEKKQ